MTRTIDNSQDILDSRDVKARFDELQGLRDDLAQEAKDLVTRVAELCNQKDTTGWDVETAKLAIDGYLQDLLGKDSEEEGPNEKEAASIAEKLNDAWVTESGDYLTLDFDYGEDEEQEFQALKAIVDELPDSESLIRDSYFETYARDYASEISTREANQWPYTCIDWERAADELKTDYSCLTFDGVDYWYRG